MLLPADHILGAIATELQNLLGQEGDSRQGSSRQSLNVGLNLLRKREREGGAAIRAQLRQLGCAISPLQETLAGNVDLADLRALIERAATLADLHELENAWRQVLKTTEALANQASRSPAIDPRQRLQLIQALAAWETGDLQSQFEQHDLASASEGQLDADRLQHYLQDRFNDNSLKVTRFQSLAGGFGKQTFLFDTEGKALQGSFVMRRDPATPLVENDCHLIDREYELIRAVHEKGFPAPDAIWLDTRHELLPGGDFLIMNRSPGESGGSVFAAQGEVPRDLAETLAGILARLHNLPPMESLNACSESICAERWDMPLDACVRRYLSDWFETFKSEEHLPSPTLVGQFNWLLANVPASSGRPVLLHGDMGFHNFLFDNGKLSAVLDWEFAHLGDPAEDLAYVRNTIGSALDWPAFMAAYQAAGGHPVDERRLHFFQVWGHVRNAAGANIASAKFASTQLDDLKLVILPHIYIPQFLRAAQALIDQGLPGGDA